MSLYPVVEKFLVLIELVDIEELGIASLDLSKNNKRIISASDPTKMYWKKIIRIRYFL